MTTKKEVKEASAKALVFAIMASIDVQNISKEKDVEMANVIPISFGYLL